MRALILGGTSDANALSAAIARARIDAMYSYAGRTQSPVAQTLPTRLGGFGGASGLAAFIAQKKITHVIDATHPFAAEMSRNAVAACAATGAALIALERTPWTPVTDDKWIEVPDISAAVAALPATRARVFLAIGRQHLAPFGARPQHAYTLRFVDAPDQSGTVPFVPLPVSVPLLATERSETNTPFWRKIACVAPEPVTSLVIVSVKLFPMNGVTV